MNDLARFDHNTALTAADMRMQVNRIQEVMKAVMKDGVHYGKIPGTPKPTLYKPGAEVLAATFHIAVSYEVEDLSIADCARYRIRAIGTHQASGIRLGEGMGACSSLEEKYKWRKAASNSEFENTDPTRRRIKYGYDREKRQEYEIKQVRTEGADLDNTVLKMACKRAQVAMTLNVVAASDIFTQDIEDLPEELRTDDDALATTTKVEGPQAKEGVTETSRAAAKQLTAGQVRIIKVKMDKAALTKDDFQKRFGMPLNEGAVLDVNGVLAWIADPTKA